MASTPPSGSVAALKEFFGDVCRVTNAELLELRKADPQGFDELARDAKAELAKQK